MAIEVKDATGATVSKKTNDTGTEADNVRVDIIATGASADIGNSTSAAAIITDVAGPLLGFARGIVKLIIERFPLSLGQKAMAASFPVVWASDQGALEVGQRVAVITVTPTVSTTPAYTSGDSIGGKQTVSNVFRLTGGAAILDSLTVIDSADQKAPFDLLLFDSDPVDSTITDNTAFGWDSGEETKVLARVRVLAGDYISINAKAIATLYNLGIALDVASGVDLFAAIVTTGTPTYTTTSDLQLRLGLRQN